MHVYQNMLTRQLISSVVDIIDIELSWWPKVI